MTNKYAMNEQELDMVAGGISGQQIAQIGEKLYRVGKKLWDFFHKH